MKLKIALYQAVSYHPINNFSRRPVWNPLSKPTVAFSIAVKIFGISIRIPPKNLPSKVAVPSMVKSWAKLMKK